jgi:MarR family transcriptional regulator for hemolysin
MPQLHHDARSRFGIRFSMLARRWRRELDHSLSHLGLTSTTWAPLIHLDEAGDGISQKALAALLGSDAASLVRLLDILARDGFLERRADPLDKRSRLIFLTPAGRERVAFIREALAASEAAMLADLSDDQVDLLNHSLSLIDVRITQLALRDDKNA